MSIKSTCKTTNRGSYSCNACSGPHDTDGRILEDATIIEIRMSPEYASSDLVVRVCEKCRDRLIQGLMITKNTISRYGAKGAAEFDARKPLQV